MKIIYKNIKDLKPYENNPRDNRKAIAPVVESIRHFGFRVPIIIDEHDTIIAGHTRYIACKELGITEIPTITADGLTDDQIKAFRVVDNKTNEYAKWDEDLLRIELAEVDIDLSPFDLDLFQEPEVEIIEDDFDMELPDEPKSKRGDIYQLGNHRLMCGDSTNKQDFEQLMNGEKVDLVVTDPPYNVNYGSKADAINKYGYAFSDRRIENDYMPSEQFIEFLDKSFYNMKESLKEGAAFYIFHASITVFEFELALRLNSLQSRQQLVWVKNALVLGRQDYQWIHEPILYGWKDGAAHYFINDRKKTTVFEDEIDIEKLSKKQLKEIVEKLYEGTLATTVLRVDKPTRSEEHPTMKPIILLSELIKNSSKAKQKVLDLFGGSGSTLIASEQLDRECYMMEYDPKYVDVIIARWEKFTGKKAIKL